LKFLSPEALKQHKNLKITDVSNKVVTSPYFAWGAK